jgi:hypothetical protein
MSCKCGCDTRAAEEKARKVEAFEAWLADRKLREVLANPDAIYVADGNAWAKEHDVSYTEALTRLFPAQVNRLDAILGLNKRSV